MSTTFVILLVALIAGLGIFAVKNETQKQKCVKWFYLICCGLAWYTIETTTRSEPIHMSMLVVLLLCLIPMAIDSLLYQKDIRRKY